MIIKQNEDVMRVMENIGVSKGGISYMQNKFKYRMFLLFNVDAWICNIVKQEMLSIGGEAAVNEGCINCTVKTSDILIGGTIKQIQQLLIKMRAQSPKFTKYIKEIEERGYLK